MENQPEHDALAALRQAAVLREHQFASRVPLAGRAIAAFRRAWNNVSTRWYVAHLIQQQTTFNQLTVDRLAEIMALLDRQAEQLTMLERELGALRGEATDLLHRLGSGLPRVEEWLIEQDREQTELRHDLGELALRVGQLTRTSEAGPPVANQGGKNKSSDPAA